MNARFRIPLLLLLGLLVSRCSIVEPEADRDRVPPRALSLAEQHLTESDNRFGFKLFRALSDEAPGDNLFISPLSVSMALGMTLNGAAGETRTAMEETLELAGLSQDDINAAYQSLIELLAGLDPEVAFELANSIWYRQDFAVEPDFIDVNQTYFDAEVQGLDFAAPSAPGTINGWIDEKTHGKIEEVIDQIKPNTVMFLINALYFKGTWTYEFDPDDTQTADFTPHDGPAVSVSMMYQQADLPYFETEVFQAVDLPYGDSLFSMTILLPRPGVHVDSLAAGIDEAQWDDWTGRFETQAVDLRLPRFELEYKENLNDVLAALGMGIAFSDAADFTGINRNGGLRIDDVIHKTFVEVNEEGTEAAAVTVVEIVETSAGGGPVPVHVDRPFVFSIRERHSGTLLFIGKVNTL